MQGFFSINETKSESRPDGKVYSCAACGLYKYAKTVKFKPYGEFEKKILLVVDFPNEVEDRTGMFWQGERGRFLQKTLQRFGIDLYTDCLSVFAVACRPVDEKGKEKEVEPFQKACCSRNLVSVIKQYKPKVIIAFGMDALYGLLWNRWKKAFDKIEKWRGWTIPDRKYSAWVCPVFSVDEVLQKQEYKEVETVWRLDLKKAFSMVEKPFPSFTDEQENVTIIDMVDDALAVLAQLEKSKFFAFDIETSGLKPYNTKEHIIACLSFCYSGDKSYVLPYEILNIDSIRSKLKSIMENEKIGKIAANMKYEYTWLKIIYGVECRNFIWDTMQAAHVLDNRNGITSLKFQAYINFGVVDYDSEIEPYIKTKSSNSLNKIKEVMQNAYLYKQLLVYCGMDSLFTYRLALKQMKEMDGGKDDF